MSAPLVPADVDLRVFDDMPLDVRRLRDSKFTATVTPEEFRAGVLLWCAAWHQVPAGSLPDDDVELSKLAGYGYAVKEWRRVKKGALYGWDRADDGRLYHETAAEKALSSWTARLRNVHGKYCDRLRKENKRRADLKLDALPIPTFEDWNSTGRPEAIQSPETKIPPEAAKIPSEKRRRSGGIPAENALNRKEGKGVEGKGSDVTVPPPSAPEPPQSKTVAPPAKERPDDAPKTAAVWEAYCGAYRERYGAEPKRNAKVNGLLSQLVDRLGADEAPPVAAFYLQSNRGLYTASTHAVDLLIRDAEALRTAWATRRHATDSEARQGDKTQARGDVWDAVREETRDAS